MSEPTFLEFALLVTVCLLLAFFGLYLLAGFRNLFRHRIRNEIIRRNVAAWLIIFLISASMSPLSNGFFLLLAKFGWWSTLVGHLLSTTLMTVVAFNIIWAVAESKRLKQLSFVKHQVLILFTVIVMVLLVNLPFSYFLLDGKTEYLKYTIVSSIYIGGASGLIYAVISYQDLERKRKFDEKELELSKLRELKSKAELEALHSKVNPHFLYNALNSIADLSVTDGKKARKMTVALADLFRYSINYNQHNYSTVRDELEMTEVYLQIEKIRFEDQLNYLIRKESEADFYLLPRFLLQPLVENAVKHGLKATGRMTEIVLEIDKKEDGLVIRIRDNGPPFPDDLVPGYGVKSVFDKLDLLFPGQYEIHFSNDPVKQVVIHITKLMKNEPGVQGDLGG